MKNIIEIYKEYNTMPMLVLHQMRVAAVAMQICESVNIEVDKDNVIKACLLHDMGNIIKSQLDKFPSWNEPEGTVYWQGIKNNYIFEYGNDEHIASVEIAKKLGSSSYTIDLIDCIDSDSIEKITMDSDVCKKICMYADGRVNPHGVVSIEERSIEAKERYKDHPHSFDEERRLFFNKNLFEIENQIFSHSNIKPEDINDESIKIYLEKIKNIVI